MSKKVSVSTIADVEKILVILKQEAAKDPKLEGKYDKKLAQAAELLSIKDGVTKDLNQAYTYGKNWWSTNVTDGGLEGCTMHNKDEKIMQHVMKSSAYTRHFNNAATKEKVEMWMLETFTEPEAQQEAA
ncbi:MAG TPA: hypothetical protein VN642_07295 [Dongiaceae bacterium]|nr:hypothetical protein [Dongiaceae bacterium]